MVVPPVVEWTPQGSNVNNPGQCPGISGDLQPSAAV